MTLKMFTTVLFFLSLWAASSLGALDRDYEWWDTTVIYQIYPRSFKDSNGDGVGDLNGITEKLDYLKDIGIETVWIQPFYKSPGADMGYDVSDYTSVDPLFGSMNDFKNLVNEIHDRDMKIILDFVPNHVSNQHDWFRLSEARVEPFTDFFLWRDPKITSDGKKTYPNNWLSVFGGSGWTWSDKRKQYYFKQFSAKQPDLNFQSPKMIESLNDVLRFWLDLGVDGFRVDAVKHLVEAEHLMDEPVIAPSTGENDYETLDHIYTQKQPENYQLIRQWRQLLQEYDERDGKSRLLCTEDYDTPIELRRYFGNDTYQQAQMPFYFGFVRLNYRHNATILNYLVKSWVEAVPYNMLPNWVLDNHDNYRVSTRLDSDTVDAMNMLELLLPGSASVYYGAELGLEDSIIRPDQIRDPNNGGNGRTDSRDPSRGPMIWDGTKNAGFTTNEKPWLPVSPHYWRLNVKSQLEQPFSHLEIFKRLTALRKTPVIKFGDLQSYALSEWTYMFVRSVTTKTYNETVAVILNLGSETDTICAKKVAPILPEVMTVHTSSWNSGLSIGDKVILSNTDDQLCTELRPKAGVVLTTNHGTLLTHSIYLIFLAGLTNLLRLTYN